MVNNHMIIKVWFTRINLSAHLNREALTLIFKPLNTAALSKQLTALYSCSLQWSIYTQRDSYHVRLKTCYV